MTCRTITRALGAVITVAALAYFLVRLVTHSQALLDWKPTSASVGRLFLLTSAYALNLCLMASAWHVLLGIYEKAQARQDMVIYARSAIAKYLPGNVFHFAGRHVASRGLGYRHFSIASGAVFEIVGQLLAASLLTLAGLAWGTNSGGGRPYWLFLAFVGAGTCPLLVIRLAHRLPCLSNHVSPPKDFAQSGVRLFSAYGLHLLYFIFCGAIFWGTVGVGTHGAAARDLGHLISTYAVSWVAGFITVGAPAGLGVREAVMVAGLGEIIDPGQAVLVALLFRAVTTMGDLFFFALSYLPGVACRRRDQSKLVRGTPEETEQSG